MTSFDSDLPSIPSLQEALNVLMAQNVGRTFPACALAVLRQGQVVVNQAWGGCESQVASTESLFDIASLTKLFTATVFLRCVSEGLVGLDDPLCAILPEFARSGPRPIEGGQDPHTLQRQPLAPELTGHTVDPRRVTFRHLLTHTSGLAAWRDVFALTGQVPTAPELQLPLQASERLSLALDAICQYPFIDQPGHRVVYSDLGFILLGQAVQVLCGRPLEQAIQTLLLDPLGLTHTLFNPVHSGRVFLAQTLPTEWDQRWRKRRVWGEVHDENACALGGVSGHAGLFSTAMDVARFGQAWLSSAGSMGVSQPWATQAKWEQAVTGDERRGWGFAIKSLHNASAGDLFSPQTFGHTGFTGCTLWVDPQRECVVSCLTNGVYQGRAAHAPHAFRRQLHDLLAEHLKFP